MGLRFKRRRLGLLACLLLLLLLLLRAREREKGKKRSRTGDPKTELPSCSLHSLFAVWVAADCTRWSVADHSCSSYSATMLASILRPFLYYSATILALTLLVAADCTRWSVAVWGV